jgi:hypothetical protein
MPLSAIEADEADELFEADEGFGESDESDEAARRPGRFGRPPQVASGRNLFKPRPQSQYVTQTQLETALAKVGAQVKTNSTAITQLSGRISSTSDLIKKETSERKKDVTGLKNNLNQTQQIAAILPLLTPPNSVAVHGLSADGIPDNTKVLVDSGNTLNLLLPMLLLTGQGNGGGTSGGLFGGGDNTSLMTLALILALGK